MRFLNNLNDAADQLMHVPLADGSIAQFEFIYRPAAQRWSLNVTHPSLTIRGLNITQGPNILRQWRNVVSFGLAVISVTGLDPIQVGDFLNGNVLVYVMSAAEVQLVESQILAPVPLVNP